MTVKVLLHLQRLGYKITTTSFLVVLFNTHCRVSQLPCCKRHYGEAHLIRRHSWRGPPDKELRPLDKCHLRELEVDLPAQSSALQPHLKPSDDCRPRHHLDYNLRRKSEQGRPPSVSPRLDQQELCEPTNVCCLSCYLWGVVT